MAKTSPPKTICPVNAERKACPIWNTMMEKTAVTKPAMTPAMIQIVEGSGEREGKMWPTNRARRSRR